MGDIKGFLKVKRRAFEYRPVCERLKDYAEVCVLPRPEYSQEQASRCMDCGTPFCHWACPVGNYIPEWNDLLWRGEWERAFQLLAATNNFPEFTARLCPALCEYACVLGINDDPVTIREDELIIIEQAFKSGLLKPNPPSRRTAKKVAVIGSGPAGLACADQLNKAGHHVTLFEKDDKIGGILRYGIPDFKLDKGIIDRRLVILKKEGVKFITGTDVGHGYPAAKLKNEFDAVCLAGGCRVPRDLNIEGRDLRGIHFAMDYLVQANKRMAGQSFSGDELIDAKGKRVVVIGGGDTGADCVGTANRQQASCVIQIEILPQPPEYRTQDYPWPKYPVVLKTSTSHQEGGIRKWQISTRKFIGEKGRVKKLSCAKVEFEKSSTGRPAIKEIPGSDFEIDADMVILALGFVRSDKKGLIEKLRVKLDPRGNVETGKDYMTGLAGIFACGDMRIGQSLIVRAISEGRKAAYYIDKYLMGETYLPKA